EDAHNDFMENNEVLYDALEPALKFQNPIDREFAAFICSIVAYGRIVQVKRNIHAVLDPMGDSPTQWLIGSEDIHIKKLVKNWKHRFNTSHDMYLMLTILQQVYKRHQNLESFIKPSQYDDTSKLLEGFRKSLYSLIPKSARPKKSFHFFIPDPELGSASKRMNLFLKWMVRDTEPDLG